MNMIFNEFEIEHKCRIKFNRSRNQLIVNWTMNDLGYQPIRAKEEILSANINLGQETNKIKKGQIMPLNTIKQE